MFQVRRVSSVLALGILLLVCTGCVEHRVDGDVETFSYPWLAPLGLFFAGFGAAAAGWALRESRYGIVLMLGGPVASLGFAPGLFLNHVRIDNETLSIRTGMWFMPTKVDVKFSELKSVSFNQEEHSGRRGRKYNKYFFNLMAATGEQRVEVDSLVEEAVASILARLKSHDVRVIDLLQH